MSGRRRAAGEGAIYCDEKTNRWVGQLDAGRTDTGKRRRLKVTGRTRSEAADKLRVRRAALEVGDRALATMTVGDLLDEWEAAVVPTMTPNTAEQYRWSLRHLRPALGHHRLTELRAHHVEQFLKAKADGGGLNRTSLTRLRSNFGRMLRWAQRRDQVSRTVAELAEVPPAAPPRSGRSLDRDELRQMLDAARGRRLEAFWTVLAGVGLRPGEALGLRWVDVDLDSGIVHVRQALKWRENTPILGDLKTGRSRRSLGVPAPVVTALWAHRTRQAQERLALRWPAEWADLVFVSEAGTPLLMSNIRRELDKFTATASIGRLRPYDLRHTCASLLADAGVPVERIADFLGHDGIRMARTVYVHALAPRSMSPWLLSGRCSKARSVRWRSTPAYETSSAVRPPHRWRSTRCPYSP